MSGSIVKFTRLDRQYKNLKEELDEATHSVLSTGQVLDGPYKEEFERKMAKRCGRKYALCVSSATMGIYATLMTRCMLLPYGSHGITKENIEISKKKIGIPNLSFVATLNTVSTAKYIPDFYDVDRNGLFDLNHIDLYNRPLDTIMYVNLYGNILDFHELKLKTSFFNEKKVPFIIEDAAQSLGASFHGKPSGSLGDISILSFDPTKNLPNYGSGGMVLSDNDVFMSRLSEFCNNNKDKFVIPGTQALNSKMSEIDCAGMLVKLNHFDNWQKRRREIAQYYIDNLRNVELPNVNKDVVHAWHKFVIHHNSRDKLMDYLDNHGVSTKIHYKSTLTSVKTLTQADANTLSCLSLPIYPEMSDVEIEYVVERINSYT